MPNSTLPGAGGAFMGPVRRVPVGPPEIPGEYDGERLEGSVALPGGRTVTVAVQREDVGFTTASS